MGDLLRPARVHVISKEGECQVNITIDLNINLSAEGLSIQATKERKEEKEVEKDEEEKTIWAIPNFTQKDKVKFGKKKENE